MANTEHIIHISPPQCPWQPQSLLTMEKNLISLGSWIFPRLPLIVSPQNTLHFIDIKWRSQIHIYVCVYMKWCSDKKNVFLEAFPGITAIPGYIIMAFFQLSLNSLRIFLNTVPMNGQLETICQPGFEYSPLCYSVALLKETNVKLSSLCWKSSNWSPLPTGYSLRFCSDRSAPRVWPCLFAQSSLTVSLSLITYSCQELWVFLCLCKMFNNWIWWLQLTMYCIFGRC